MFKIGDQRVGIVGLTVSTAKTALFEPVDTAETVAWVDNCLFEIQTATENQTVEDVSTSEVAYCAMPSPDGKVHTTLGDVDFTDITAGKRLREFTTGRDYQMRGDAVFEAGMLPHVAAMCERQR